MIGTIVLLIANLATLVIGQFFAEYEVAKLHHPDVSWIPTPGTFDLTISIAMMVISVVNLAILYFIMTRQLIQHRKLLGWLTVVNLVLVLILVIVLRDRFLPILWPSL